MASYPNTLPAPNASNYSGTPDKAFLRTNMESGSPRQRRLYTASNEALNVSWRFKATEFSTFKTFFHTTINQGADWFLMSVDIGNGFNAYNCRFTEAYQYSRLPGANWEVTAKIEVRNA